MQILKCVALAVLAAPVFASDGSPVLPQQLTVHEWGTFTTVAGENGAPDGWSPLALPSDLPCFVMHLHGLQYKVLSPAPNPTNETVTVRMETPVLYFYAPRQTTVSVGVDFPKGLITEWYPAASKVTPAADIALPPVRQGHIEWSPLVIAPGENPALPTGSGASHYYAARDTDAAPVRIGGQQEKLLFYRGIASFDVPVHARITGDATVEVRNTGADALSLAVLFENRSGRIGYRILHGLRGLSELDAPELTANLDSLKHDLSDALVTAGLYRKEADAMIATWRDSWFEEGMRIFYLAPREMVDRELPLTIAPAPATIERVFVGRVELLSPYRRDLLAAAVADGNVPTLESFDRFLTPFLRQVDAKPAPATNHYLAGKAEQAKQEFYQPSCVR